MEKTYWLGRKHASMAMADKASSAEARLHLDLAGRYSIWAAALGSAAAPQIDRLYYDRLEKGARHLAAEAANDGDRDTHLKMANRYVRLGLDMSGGKGI